MNVRIPEQYREGYERSLRLYDEIKKARVREVRKKKSTKYYYGNYIINKSVSFSEYEKNSWNGNMVAAVYLPLNVESVKLYTSNGYWWNNYDNSDSFDINIHGTIKPLEEILKESKELPRDDFILSLNRDERFTIKEDDMHHSEDIVEVDNISYRRVSLAYPFLNYPYSLKIVPENICVGIERVVLTSKSKWEIDVDENEYVSIINCEPPKLMVTKNNKYSIVPIE